MKKNGVHVGPGVDLKVVEQVKALKAIGRPDTQIAKELGIHVATVGRYKKREDESPEWAEARALMIEKFEDKSWECIWGLYDIVKEAIDNKEFKGKDAVLSLAILIDKILILQKPTKEGALSEPISFNFTVNATQHRSIADTGEVPHVIEQVPGDGVRPGGGENIFRLPRSGEDES